MDGTPDEEFHRSSVESPPRSSPNEVDDRHLDTPINEEVSPQRPRSLSVPAEAGGREYIPSPRPIFDRLAARTVRFRGNYDDTKRRSKRKKSPNQK